MPPDDHDAALDSIVPYCADQMASIDTLLTSPDDVAVFGAMCAAFNKQVGFFLRSPCFLL